MKNYLVIFTLVAAFSIPNAALAQDPKFDYAKGDDKKDLPKDGKVEWKASAQAGGVLTTGNSRTSTVTGGATASRKEGSNKLAIAVNGAYARSTILIAADADNNGTIDADEIDDQSQTTAKAWSATARYDRFLTDANAVYVAGNAGGDVPAGKDFVGGGQLGYSRQLFKDKKHELVGEAGYDFSYEDLAVGNSLSIHSLRAFAGYKGTLRKDTGLEASVELLVNLNSLNPAQGEIDSFKDRRTTGMVALTTKLFDDVSFRLAFTAKHDSAPAPRPVLALPYSAGFVPVAEELDTKTEASIIVSFL